MLNANAAAVINVITWNRCGMPCPYDDNGIIRQASERVVADNHPALQIRGIEAHQSE
jgi:hypothetical protein